MAAPSLNSGRHGRRLALPVLMAWGRNMVMVLGLAAMTDAHVFALGLALACLAGVRAYLTVFGVGLAGLMGWVDLPAALEATTSPWVLGTAGALAVVEFAADKIPGVDSGWDLLQTLARIPAGAFLAAATMSPDGSRSYSSDRINGYQRVCNQFGCR